MVRSWSPRFERFSWALAGAALFLVVALVVHAFVGALVAGLFLYYALRPLYRRLADRVGNDSFAATVTLLAVGLPILAVLAVAVVVGVHELDQFLRSAQLEAYRSVLTRQVSLESLRALVRAPGLSSESAARVLALTGTAGVWLLRLFVVCVVAFYLLRDDDELAGWVRERFDAGAVRFFEGVDDDLTTLYTGNLLTVVITAAVATTTLYAFDALAPGEPVGYPFLLGLLVGVGTLVPVLGIKLVYLPVAAFLFARSLVWGSLPLWVPVAFLLVMAVVVDFVPDVFIRSYVSKGDLHMGLVLLAYVLGTVAFGWYGIFLAPVVLVLALHFARRVLPNVVDRDATRMVFE